MIQIKNSTSVKRANNHYHLLQERKVTYVTVTNLQRMSTMLDLDGMGRDVAIRPLRVPEGTRYSVFKITTRTLLEKFYYSAE